MRRADSPAPPIVRDDAVSSVTTTIETPAPAASPPRKRRRRIRIILVVGVLAAAAALVPLPAWASMFGEENTTLVQMLVQFLQLNRQVSEVSQTVGKVADSAQDLVQTYKRVNAGIDAIRNYNLDSFVSDVKTDVYNQYPGFAKLELASRNLGQWDNTRSTSPWTAYEAVTAVVGDASKALKGDVAAGRVNVDPELILAGEASGGMAAAHTAEQMTERFDKDVATLNRLARSASPAQAEQISARASLLIAAQNSYMMRLLARGVRFDSVDAALQYGSRIGARNSAYEVRDETEKFMAEASRPPTLIDFNSEAP